MARMAGLLAGVPTSVPGVTENRLCGSGLEAVMSASREIAVGDADLCIAGGVESMTRAPWVVPKPAHGVRTQSPADALDDARLANRQPAASRPVDGGARARAPRSSPTSTASAAPSRTRSRFGAIRRRRPRGGREVRRRDRGAVRRGARLDECIRPRSTSADLLARLKSRVPVRRFGHGREHLADERRRVGAAARVRGGSRGVRP